MTPTPGGLPNELSRRHRTATIFVVSFLVLDLVLLAVAYYGASKFERDGDQSIVMGLWIAILVCGLGAFVLRRTRFATLRLKDIAALKGMSGLLKTLQGTTIQIAILGGAIGIMGFVWAMLTHDWTNMLRATGVSVIVLIYGFPIRTAWERVARQLAEYSQPS